MDLFRTGHLAHSWPAAESSKVAACPVDERRIAQSGAMNERLASIERELGVLFPAALRSLYETSDGRFHEEGRWWVVWPLDCVEVGGTSSEILRWNWIDLAVERSEGSVDEFIAEWCSEST
jgi:cell wall assembly regulator SMI1